MTKKTDWKIILSSDTSRLELPKATFVAPIANAFKCFLRLHNNLEIKGTENIPANGNFIIAPNHQSFLDGPICTTGLKGRTLRNTYYYATEEHVRDSVTRFVANNSNIIRMERRNLRNSILKLGKVLNMGKNIVIFPEGRRTDDGKVGEFKKTFAILSKELQVPIVPVRILGAYEALPRGKKFPNNHKITIEYLKPIMPLQDESYEQVAERVRSAIAGKDF